MKNLIRLTGGIVLISGFLFLTHNSVLTYDNKTVHPDLTREAITFYEFSSGKRFTEEQKQWIVQGSIDEDLAPRWLNHFYDPVYEKGLSTALPGINGYSAKNWAQFSSYQTVNIGNIFNLWTGNGPVISGSEWGDFSFEAAVKNYSQNKGEKAYTALGHLLHLIEDMAVPEHTRNDSHISGTQWASYYESWTMRNSSGLTQNLGRRLFDEGNKLIIYANLETYFNNLASYTNNNFFSPRTANYESYQKPEIVFNDETFAYGKDENGKLFDLAYIEKNFTTKKVVYNVKKEQILQEYWLRLSRQAIVNSAGVIQLFLDQAEAVRQVELAKQKVEAGQPKNSLISQIYNFFISPEAPTNEPDLVIVSEPSVTQPKVKPVVQSTIIPAKPTASSKSEESKPVVVNTAPKPTPNPTIAPNPIIAPVPQQQVSTPVVYGGGSVGVSSTQDSSTQQTSQNQSTTTPESLSVQTFNAGDLVINEIMYDLAKVNCTADGTDANHEWVEIYNNSGRNIALTGGDSGWRFNDGSNHLLNEQGTIGSMTIPAAGYVILSASTTVFLSDYPGFSGAVIDTAMSLKNSTSTIEIKAPDGTIIDEVTYYSFWGAKHNCKTLERKTAAGSSGDQGNWAESSANDGTPGAINNFIDATSSTSVVATSTLEIATTTLQITNLGTDIPATTIITENTTWTLAGSPYRLFFDGQQRPTVATGAILTIEPGVKIIPQGGNYTALEIQGMLQAIANSGAPIIFTSINNADNLASTTPQKGEWLNIVFSAGSQGNLDFVEFSYGGQGLWRPLKEMVKIIGATVNINHSTFKNSESIALRLVDSNGVIENSIFSDNSCGISVDSLVDGSGNTDGGCYGVALGYSHAVVSTTPQIRNNQFIRNQTIAIEVRNGATPIVDNNIFTDNYYPIRIEGSYPTITNSQLANSIPQATSTFFGGIAISDHALFSQDYTLKKDLPYILEANYGYSPHIESGATLTIEPGVILKPNQNTFPVLFVYGTLIASSTPENPIVFTSFKEDTQGGDTNGDGLITSPQDRDWANIKFFAGSVGNFTNTLFNYGGYGFVALPVPPANEISIENFDNYSAGALSGQGDWGGGNPSDQIAITSATIHEGVNSVGLSGGSGAYTYRVLTQPMIENGTLSFWIYYNSLGDQGISLSDSNDNILAKIYYDTNNNCSTSDGNCWTLMGDGDMGHFVRTSIQTTINAWHFMELEMSFSDRRVRMRQDGGVWSDWAISNRTNFGRMRFNRDYGNTFFDTFTFVYSTPIVLTNPALSIDDGALVVVQ